MSQLASAPRRPSSTSSGSPANESCGLRVANNSTTASTSTPRATNANACGGPGQPLRVIGTHASGLWPATSTAHSSRRPCRVNTQGTDRAPPKRRSRCALRREERAGPRTTASRHGPSTPSNGWRPCPARPCTDTLSRCCCQLLSTLSRGPTRHLPRPRDRFWGDPESCLAERLRR